MEIRNFPTEEPLSTRSKIGIDVNGGEQYLLADILLRMMKSNVHLDVFPKAF